MERIIFHIDVNSAFLSWSAASRVEKGIYPDLRDIPSAVGGNEKARKGIILAKSVPAKKYGIKTGEPIFTAKKKCPELEIVPPEFDLYKKYSDAMYEVCNRFSPALERFSIDELFLDYTNMDKLFGAPVDTANKIRETIKSELGFTVNIGISSNKLLAKMASDFEKPNKVHTLFQYEIKEKMWPLPVSDLFMVGRKTAARLHSLNIHTIGQLANTDEAFLKSRFKEHGTLMHRYANGDDVSDITPIPQPPKSIGHGTTLPENITDTEKAHTAILALCEKVSARLRSLSLKCTYVDVYIRYADFSGVSQRSQNPPTDSTNAIFKNAKYIINSMWDNSPIRAITVTLGGLCNKNETQCSFIDEENQNEGCEIDNAVDRMRSKYGFECVTRASLLKNPLYKKIKNDNIPKMQSKL